MPQRKNQFGRCYLEVKTRNNGRKDYYVRRYYGGTLYPIPNPDHPDFNKKYLDAIRQAEEDISPVARKTKNSHQVGWLITKFMASQRWQAFKVSTRKNYAYKLAVLKKHFGTLRFDRVSGAMIYALMESYQDTPSTANKILYCWRSMCSWARGAHLISLDPSVNLQPFEYDRTKHKAWTQEEINKFRAFYKLGTMERTAFELLSTLGLRESDLICLGPDNIKGDIIEYTSIKTKTLVTVALPDNLKQALDAMGTHGRTFVVSERSQEPYKTTNNFYRWFRKTCRRINITKAPHGLRGSMAIRLLLSEHNYQQVMAFGGWRSVATVKSYAEDINWVELGLSVESDRLKPVTPNKPK